MLVFFAQVLPLAASGVRRSDLDGNRAVDFPDSPLIFGDAPEGGNDCLYGIADRADPRILPNLWIDCGTEDDLIEDNRTYVRHLDSLEIPHEYQEFPGAHTWDYWDTHIQDAISFHRRILRNS